ncbi:MAG: hypothetical protein IJL71_02520 [Oscillospiraceae bacterium]|nr:hypothetical protein [Oscillospiraceae bacterium]
MSWQDIIGVVFLCAACVLLFWQIYSDAKKLNECSAASEVDTRAIRRLKYRITVTVLVIIILILLLLLSLLEYRETENYEYYRDINYTSFNISNLLLILMFDLSLRNEGEKRWRL